jgi:hypothetical protein
VAERGRTAAVVTAHDRRRLRLTWVALAVGAGLGLLGTAWTALGGASGAVGFAMLLLGVALGSVVGALVTGVLAVVDEIRGQPVARRRLWVAVGLFVAGLVTVTLGAAAAA